MINLGLMYAEHRRILQLEKRSLDIAIASAATVGINTASAATPVDTGALKRANKSKVIRTARGRVLRLSNSKKYAAAQDKGSRAHTITAKGGGYLHFKGSQGWRRPRSVRHPGTKPLRFLQKGRDAASANIRKSFVQLMRAGLRR